MKRLLFIALPLLMACGSDDDFTCEQNARFVYNGGTECAHASVDVYSENFTTGGESFVIAFTNRFTNFKLTLFDDEDLVPNKEYTYPENASITGPGHNQTFSLKITLTKFDREANIISGTFVFEAERDSNSTAVEFNSDGAFTDVPYVD
ncbi:MAG: hypothetical protein R2820_15030 [Cyclobacteriaceae bacterium]|nr:hypothetical protein [Cyclobacteriaceae bacterium]